jgi:hypothetical protein
VHTEAAHEADGQANGQGAYGFSVGMNDTAQIITALAALIAAIGGLVIQIMSFIKMHQVAHNTDGIKDALVASTAKASHAEGLKEGREETK